jgi:hypothetical protein
MCPNGPGFGACGPEFVHVCKSPTPAFTIHIRTQARKKAQAQSMKSKPEILNPSLTPTRAQRIQAQPSPRWVVIQKPVITCYGVCQVSPHLKDCQTFSQCIFIHLKMHLLCTNMLVSKGISSVLLITYICV